MNQLRILVTGASGFIGSRVVETLSEHLPEALISGVGRTSGPFEKADLPNYTHIECDLLEDDIRSILPGKTDVLIHLAGDRRTFVKPGDISFQMRSNVLMTSGMAEYAVAAGTKLFLYSSSVYVYSGNRDIPFSEEPLLIPGENLGATKLASEALLKARAVAGQFKAASFRMGTVFGPRSGATQFIPQAIMKLAGSEPVAAFGAGDVKRDFVFVDDVARAFASAVDVLLEKDFDYEALNIGAGEAVSIRDVVKVLAKEIGTEKKTEFSVPAGRVNRADTDHRLDLTRVRSVLGWQPAYSLAEGLRQTIKSYL